MTEVANNRLGISWEWGMNKHSPYLDKGRLITLFCYKMNSIDKVARRRSWVAIGISLLALGISLDGVNGVMAAFTQFAINSLVVIPIIVISAIGIAVLLMLPKWMKKAQETKTQEKQNQSP